MTRRPLRNLLGAQDGATLVEFAFVAPVFLLLLMGVFDLGHGVYIKAVLQGAMQQAGRDSGLESGPEKQEQIDEYVREQVLSVVKGELNFVRQNYWEFGDVGEAEDYTDANNNGVYDPGECFYDANENGVWDDRGRAGLGGAKDVVLYTAELRYDYLFPLWSFLGRDRHATMTASTTLRNQPFGSQGSRSIKYVCP